MNLFSYTYEDAAYLWLLLFIPIISIWYYFVNNKYYTHFKISSTEPFETNEFNIASYWKHIYFSLKMLALIFIIIAMARPQSLMSEKMVTTEGIDIVLAMDISTSMEAMDFKPNRIEASKEVASNFIKDRINDRIGLVVFGGESFTQCPLTTDHLVLQNLLLDLKCGIVEDGTAIGMGLGNAVSRIKDSDSKSKVIILLTDGVNNTGSIAPLTAAEIAKDKKIRVYTIGVGTKGEAPYPFKDFMGNTVIKNVEVDLDENTLKKIADKTGGKYFRADNRDKLIAIYNEIDKLEKTKIEENEIRNTKEEFLIFLLAGISIIIIALFIDKLVFRNIL